MINLRFMGRVWDNPPKTAMGGKQVLTALLAPFEPIVEGGHAEAEEQDEGSE